ncbi:MAG: response regulator [Ktedonobacterales bacterium]|nr:response regulator [Ktedonobacterales bacterium]
MDVSGLEIPSPVILVIEDDHAICLLLRETLEVEGFTVLTATTGEEGVSLAQRDLPHLVLLDLMLPGIDGFEVVRQLRGHERTEHLPIVILSARHDVYYKVRALESANDYLTKPFNGDELLARIRTQLRHLRSILASPLTGLPAGLRVEHAVEQRLRSTEPWAILYLDLDHFKAYNDVYGFLAGNELIRLLARVAADGLRDEGNPSDFLGHIGGDDFIITTTPDCMEPLCQRIEASWDRESRALYSAEDLQRGTLLAEDRQGQRQAFPLVTVSIGVVTNLRRSITTMEAFSRIAAEVKQRAKSFAGSSHYVDQRTSSRETLDPTLNALDPLDPAAAHGPDVVA